MFEKVIKILVVFWHQNNLTRLKIYDVLDRFHTTNSLK